MRSCIANVDTWTTTILIASKNKRKKEQRGKAMPPPITDLLRSRGGQSRNNTATDNNNVHHRGHDTVLPLHNNNNNKNHHHGTQSSSSSTRNTTTTKNNFLLGGMYVPNKDRRRRRIVRHKHRSNNTIYELIVLDICQPVWNRRSIIMVVLLGGLLFCCRVVLHTQMPTSLTHPSDNNQHQHRYSGYFGGGNGHNNIDRLLHDPTLLTRLLPIQDERNRIESFAHEQIQQQLSKIRLKVLESLVPDWFHRNDRIIRPQPVGKDNHEEAISKNDIRKPQNAIKINHDVGDAVPALDTNKQKVSTSKRKDDAQPLLDEYPTVTPHRVLRTFDNIDTVATVSTSSCTRNLSNTDLSVTLVIQSTIDRIWILNETCLRWKSPIVLVVAMRPNQRTDPIYASTFHDHVTQWKESCTQLNVMVYHLNPETESSPEQYPVNTLRNVALDAVRTSHVLVMDVDFVPSNQLDEIIQLVLSEQLLNLPKNNDISSSSSSNNDANNHVAMVVPAFERVVHPPCTTDTECANYLQIDSSFIPRTFDELKECYENRECIVFQKEVNWEGHSSTRTKAWLQKKWYRDDDDESNNNQQVNNDKQTSLNIRTIPCFDSLRYEPYVVVRWCPITTNENESTPTDHPPKVSPVAPYYDERFHGYGKNKIQLISHLRIMGYQFNVLPQGFIVHNPHIESAAKDTWNNINENTLHHTMDALYQTFLHKLVEKYLVTNDQPSKIVNACSHHDPERQ
jgi:Glycosyl-transferase for dystroglycan